MSIEDIALNLFYPVAKALGKICDRDLEAAQIRIYPPTYGAIIMLATSIVSLVSLLTWFILFYFGVVSLLTFPLALIPSILVFVFLLFYPKIKIADREAALASETPFAAAYIAVMSTGGISPYASITRLGRFYLLPSFREFARILELKVRGMGLDPVSGIEEVAKNLPSKDFKELLLGYASTLRVGGDVVHYLMRRTELLFQQSLSSLRIIGERMIQLMEVYMVVAVLLSLGIYSIFAISSSMSFMLPEGAMGIFASGGAFILFSYILMPMFSLVFLWMIDLMQPKHPSEDISPYIVYLLTFIPLTILLGIPLFFSFIIPQLENIWFIRVIRSPVVRVSAILRLPSGFEPIIGLITTLIVATIPATLYTSYIDFLEGGMEFEMGNFLRDLVEVRKSGLSPEKCIISLADRNYGKLTKHIRIIAKQIGWGISFSKIYEDLSKRIRSWMTKVSFFLLIDTIEVGGGMPETLEALTQFNEAIIVNEREKNAMMRPMFLVPYIGAATLLLVIVTLLAFFNSLLRTVQSGIPYNQMVMYLLPPVIIQTYLMGLVSGKVATTKTYEGFKHAIFLLIFSLVIIALVPYINAMVNISPT